MTFNTFGWNQSQTNKDDKQYFSVGRVERGTMQGISLVSLNPPTVLQYE